MDNRRSTLIRFGRRGNVMLYVVVTLPVFLGFAGFAVDVGRLQLSKTEAQTCADAAARYAASGAANSSTPSTTAKACAAAIAAQSYVDGGRPTINASEVILGTYNSTTKLFTASSTGDCVQVTVRQILNRTGGVPLFMSIFRNGNAAQQVTATAVARCTVTTTTISPPASGNLWLSGMPDNTTTQNGRSDDSTVWDNNGTSTNQKQRPLVVDLTTVGLSAGDTIKLEGLSGSASWQNWSSGTTNTADGDTTFLVANGATYPSSVPSTSNNGIANVRAPIGAVMGVFLTSNAPNLTSAPAGLDFGTQAQRDYSSISPLTKQVFFIGDGKTSTGETQTIVIPTGATKLYLGMMDAWQWNDNVGNFSTKLYGDTTVTLVK